MGCCLYNDGLTRDCCVKVARVVGTSQCYLGNYIDLLLIFLLYMYLGIRERERESVAKYVQNGKTIATNMNMLVSVSYN